MLEVAIEAFNRVVAAEGVRDEASETETESDAVATPAMAIEHSS